MFSSKPRSVTACVGTIAVSLGAWIPAVAEGPPSTGGDKVLYAPIQSMSHEFGSKSMSGYFVEQSATCLVTLMITEKSDPDEPTPLSPTRVRLVLHPGQIAGLDSEEGRSLNFTCGDKATTLLVDAGDREGLVAAQAFSVHETVAESR